MSAGVTPSMRAIAWNVKFTISQEEDPDPFAGIFQVSGSDLITFRDVCYELRLCFFDFSVDRLLSDGHDDHDDGDDQHDTWSHIAFGLAHTDNLASSSSPVLRFVAGSDLDKPVPSLPSLSPKERNPLTYHIVYHNNCHLPSNSSLDSHLQAKCARHFLNPARRCDRRYLPPNRAPSDPRLTLLPLRRKLRAHSLSPAKRSASSSSTPMEEDSDEFDSMLAPATININLDEAKRVMNDFRSSCLHSANSCAVSGQGESWCRGTPIGPGIQACHIVPQQHYHLYPISSSGHTDSEFAIEECPRRLQEAWRSTWNPRNGILLMKHLHDFFDARLFSIHPHTLCIRVFVPYDALIRFNGQKASLPLNVDRKALRHHYEMSCIENMAANRPILDAIFPWTSTRSSSGIGTPLNTKTGLPATPGAETEQDDTRMDESTKRSRIAYSTRDLSMRSMSQTGNTAENETADWGGKRGPLLGKVNNNDEHNFYQHDRLFNYITPWNSREFLADVNWELGKLRQD